MPGPQKPKSPQPNWKSEYQIAVVRGDVDAMRRAIELGLPINEPIFEHFSDRFTALQYAVKQGAKPGVVASLIDAGADVNARSPTGGQFTTALMIAAYDGRLDLVNQLLDAGADIGVSSENGSSALANAAAGGKTSAYERIVGRLLTAGARPDAEALVGAAWRGSPEAVRSLVAAGADVNEISRWGTALHLAVDDKRLDTVEALLAAGADPTLKLPEDRRTYPGMSALDLARANKLKKLIPTLEAAAAGGSLEAIPRSPIAAPPPVSGTWKRLKKSLATGAPAVKASLEKRVTESRLGELEVALGAKLPADVRASYLLHDGQKAGADGLFPEGFADLDCEYVLLPASGILAEWSTWKLRLDRGEFTHETAIPDDGVRADWWNEGWVPVASNGAGDAICIDLAPAEGGTSGQVILMSHEVANRARLAESFGELLDQLAAYYERQADGG